MIGVDVMDLPTTASGNKHVVVFMDYLTKWPFLTKKHLRLPKFLLIPSEGPMQTISDGH